VVANGQSIEKVMARKYRIENEFCDVMDWFQTNRTDREPGFVRSGAGNRRNGPAASTTIIRYTDCRLLCGGRGRWWRLLCSVPFISPSPTIVALKKYFSATVALKK
jgi:hypothetical protein